MCTTRPFRSSNLGMNEPLCYSDNKGKTEDPWDPQIAAQQKYNEELLERIQNTKLLAVNHLRYTI